MSYIDDDGFTQRVLERLPPRRTGRRRVGVAIGTLGLTGALCAVLRPQLGAALQWLLPSGDGLVSLPTLAGVLLGALLVGLVVQGLREEA